MHKYSVTLKKLHHLHHRVLIVGQVKVVEEMHLVEVRLLVLQGRKSNKVLVKAYNESSKLYISHVSNEALNES